jgi:hypothetical protein
VLKESPMLEIQEQAVSFWKTGQRRPQSCQGHLFLTQKISETENSSRFSGCAENANQKDTFRFSVFYENQAAVWLSWDYYVTVFNNFFFSVSLYIPYTKIYIYAVGYIVWFLNKIFGSLREIPASYSRFP